MRKLSTIVFVEHDAIVEVLLRRDANTAAEVMVRHIGLTPDDIIGIVKESVARIYLGGGSER